MKAVTFSASPGSELYKTFSKQTGDSVLIFWFGRLILGMLKVWITSFSF